MVPEYWKEFIEKYQLVGKALEIDEDRDLSGVGIEIQIMTDEQIFDEATNCYPGITVANEGYIPIGICLVGSGDSYYINNNDGKCGALYRIYHDAVSETEISDGAIHKVLENYEQLLS